MIILAVTFAVTILLGVPVAFCLGLAGLTFILIYEPAMLISIPTLMFSGIDSFPLMAIPFFVLAGTLAQRSGILPRLVDFANSIVGHLRGGLAYVNILASMFFAGVTGVAVADTAAIGSMLIPPMLKQGYEKRFTAVVTAASSIMGPIIPPSVAMIVVAYISGGMVSVGGMFLAGVIPGILIGVGMMVLVYFLARSRSYPISNASFSFVNVIKMMKSAILGLMVPVIVLGGILSGVFTPTEAGAVTVAYTLFVGLFVTKKLNLRNIATCMLDTSSISAVVLILFSTARIISLLMIMHRVPDRIAETLMSLTSNPQIFLLITLCFLLLVGFVLEAVATMIMLVPILMPVAVKFGVDPHHFGLLFVMIAQIALITPPVAVGLFLVCSIAGCKMEDLLTEIWPFIFVAFAVIILVALVPEISMWLPRKFGYVP